MVFNYNFLGFYDLNNMQQGVKQQEYRCCSVFRFAAAALIRVSSRAPARMKTSLAWRNPLRQRL